MPYAYNCTGAITLIKDSAALFTIWKTFADMAIINAGLFWTADQDHNAIGQLILAMQNLSLCSHYNSYTETPFGSYNAIHYYLANCIEADEFDMDSLLSAMVAATPDQLQYFIGLVDAYRQSLWDKPFNVGNFWV